MKISNWGGFLVVFLGFVLPNTVFAAGLSLVTSPLPVSLVADPGTSVSTELKVKNNGTETETLQMGLMKFGAYGDEGKPLLMDRSPGDSYFDWVKFSEDSFTLAPNEWKTVTMTINVPKEAAFGYYYAVTFQRKDEVIPNAPKETKVVGATASLVLLEVRVANAVRQIEVLNLSTDKKVYEFLPVNFNLKLKNSGNVHVAPHGNIFIYHNNSNKEDAVLDINAEVGNILPDSNRVFTTQWTDGFPVFQDKVEGDHTVTDSKGNPAKILNWDFSQVQKLRWGKYTAKMLLVYDDGQRDVPIEGQVSFWVIPWRILAGGGVVLVLTGAGLYLIIISTIRLIKRKKTV